MSIANLQLAASPVLLGTLLGAAVSFYFTHRVADDQPAFLCIGQQRAKAADHVSDHGGRAVFLAQLVLEIANRRHVKLGKLQAPDDRLDM